MMNDVRTQQGRQKFLSDKVDWILAAKNRAAAAVLYAVVFPGLPARLSYLGVFAPEVDRLEPALHCTPAAVLVVCWLRATFRV